MKVYKPLTTKAAEMIRKNISSKLGRKVFQAIIAKKKGWGLKRGSREGKIVDEEMSIS